MDWCTAAAAAACRGKRCLADLRMQSIAGYDFPLLDRYVDVCCGHVMLSKAMLAHSGQESRNELGQGRGWRQILLMERVEARFYLAEGFDGTVFEIVKESVEESVASTAG